MAEIPFDVIMKNHINWPDNLDVDAMSECIQKIIRIKDRIFFDEEPEHPEVFVTLFSKMEFIDGLINAMLQAGITHLNRIWLKEYSEEHRQQLLQKGLFELLPLDSSNTSAVLMCRNQNDFFVNLFVQK